jgi:hypothetical protein
MVLDPITIAKTTLSMLDAHVWHVAIEAKFTNLNKNKTWELTTLPQGRKTINSKWVFKIKTKANGTMNICKPQFVVQGYFQILSFYYAKTFSLVMKMNFMAKTH